MGPLAVGEHTRVGEIRAVFLTEPRHLGPGGRTNPAGTVPGVGADPSLHLSDLVLQASTPQLTGPARRAACSGPPSAGGLVLSPQTRGRGANTFGGVRAGRRPRL